MHESKKLAPKLIICGTGFAGQELTRLAVAKGWEIVAAYNRAGDKVGQDLGVLAGLDQKLGVIVQDCDTANYDSLDADVALIAMTDYLEKNFFAYERFLSLGINVICHGSEAYHPRLVNSECAEKIDALALQNNVTFTGAGIWDTTRIWSGILCAGPCVRIDSINHSTQTEAIRQGLHHLKTIGAGLTVEEFQKKLGGRTVPAWNTLQIPSVAVFEAYGYHVSSVNITHEPVLWDKPFYCKENDTEYPAGVAVGIRILIDVETEEGVTGNSRVEYRLFREGEEELMHWKVNGLPGMEITVKREDSGVASASSLFNRIPDVLAAEPGIQTLMDFGPLKPSTLL